MISRVSRVKQADDALRYDMQLAICIYVCEPSTSLSYTKMYGRYVQYRVHSVTVTYRYTLLEKDSNSVSRVKSPLTVGYKLTLY